MMYTAIAGDAESNQHVIDYAKPCDIKPCQPLQPIPATRVSTNCHSDLHKPFFPLQNASTNPGVGILALTDREEGEKAEAVNKCKYVSLVVAGAHDVGCNSWSRCAAGLGTEIG